MRTHRPSRSSTADEEEQFGTSGVGACIFFLARQDSRRCSTSQHRFHDFHDEGRGCNTFVFHVCREAHSEDARRALSDEASPRFFRELHFFGLVFSPSGRATPALLLLSVWVSTPPLARASCRQMKAEQDHESRNVFAMEGSKLVMHKRTKINHFTQM